MRHFVLTRFCCWWPGHYSYDDSEWLENRYSIFKKYNAKKMKEQANKNFKQLIFCDSRMKDYMSEEISSFEYETEVLTGDVSWYTLLRQYLENYKEEKIVLTRLDSDDFIDENYIDIIQKNSNLIKDDYILDISKLHWYDTNTKKLYSQKYSSSSAFSTLVCNSGDYERYFGSHGKLKNKYKYIIKDKSLNAFACVHGKNTTSRVRGSLIKNNFEV
jgi:hypothetical protein